MYESFFHLREKPFTLLPDPGFLFLSDKHRMALTLLEYGLMNQSGFTVISGDIGTGKTTLIRHLLDNMDREHTVGLISNTHREFGELLQWILLSFDIEHKGMDKVEMYQRFIDFIIDEYAHNRRTVLIVDEAQNMAAETLEELRMLSNINADKDQALQVILVGQRELRDTLRRPDLVQFAQRISVDYHLDPLSEPEVIGYIRHRLQTAGGDPELTEAEKREVERLKARDREVRAHEQAHKAAAGTFARSGVNLEYEQGIFQSWKSHCILHYFQKPAKVMGFYSHILEKSWNFK